jgi:hypothetical protein
MSGATRLTPEKIAQYRIEFADNENALIAVNVIEEWEGDLADAAESIATRNSIKGVEDNADFGSSRFCVISLTYIGSINLCVLCVFVVRPPPR